MNKPKNPNIPSVRRAFRALSSLALAVAALVPLGARAYELQDIGLASDASQTTLKLSFGKGPEGEYPLYFQKADPGRGTLTLSFLDTETPFPLGRHAVETANPLVEEILLKRITSPSGKEFLGVEIRLKEPPAGEAPVQPQPKGALKVILGKGQKGKKASWSLAQAFKSRDGYLTAKAEAPPAGPPVPGQQPAAKPDPEPAASGAPAAPAVKAPRAETPAEPASSEAEGSSQAPATIKEIRLAVTPSQEDVTVVLDPPGSTPVHTAQVAGPDSGVLELTLDGVASGLAKKEYVMPGGALFKKVRVDAKGGNVVLRFHLASRDPVHILPRQGGLTLTGAGRGDAAKAFKWSSLKPEAGGPPAADASADPVVSAHQDGQAVDANASATAGAGKAGKGKGLSSSKVFSLGKGGKNLILLKDSAALKSEPAPKAKAKSKLPLGARVERIERQGSWIKVSSNGDTGFIRAAEAAYEDELTETQVASLRKGMEEIAARMEAQRQEAEAAAAAAAQPTAMPEGAQAAVTEAEPVRVAGPAAVPSGSVALKEQAAANAAAKNDGAAPKLNMAGNPELAEKAAQDKKDAEAGRMRVNPSEARVSYNSYGRRDPFVPVEQGLSENGIDIDQMKVVGIIWQAQEPMAVLEHNKESGVSFTVKQGDPVHNGRVSRITRDQVTFDISEYGISRSYSLKLVSNKEGKKQ